MVDKRWVDLTQAADVFSFGIIVIQLFCGVVTWEPTSGLAGPWSQVRIRANQDTAQPHLEPLRALGLPEGLFALVSQCTSWRPEDRPTFASIVDSLERLAPTPPQPPPLFPMPAGPAAA